MLPPIKTHKLEHIVTMLREIKVSRGLAGREGSSAEDLTMKY